MFGPQTRQSEDCDGHFLLFSFTLLNRNWQINRENSVCEVKYTKVYVPGNEGQRWSSMTQRNKPTFRQKEVIIIITAVHDLLSSDVMIYWTLNILIIFMVDQRTDLGILGFLMNNLQWMHNIFRSDEVNPGKIHFNSFNFFLNHKYHTAGSEDMQTRQVEDLTYLKGYFKELQLSYLCV